MRRRRMLLLVTVPLVLSAIPANATDEEPLLVCNQPPAGVTEVGPDHAGDLTIDAPDQFAPVSQTSSLRFQLDLYPATALNYAEVSSELSWEIVANDWDLLLLNGVGDMLNQSLAAQPSQEPLEEVSSSVPHCGLFTLQVRNFRAIDVGSLDPLQLSLATGSVK